ncbi:DUF3139 domain-containing protein [Clostridium sp. 'White wine YQ']|uniref:DUF3139 domain-containing protein n=1 Tax=Clostridium sp. 'White wine YQ' TaxID=3027474 RepID=UPI002366E143|nr:DUF3139 domain-containing protein [Clostridium sp. 'White wine YQ']MDD7794295.1 DUF3139 domain-containing protein [Clostridium sp. 'White wine YQ']
MKRIITIIAIIIVLIGGTIFYFQKSYQNQKVQKITEGKVAMVKFLSEKNVNEEGYDLFVDYRLDSKLLGYGGYVIKVVYKDEPNVTYVYDYDVNGKIEVKSSVDTINSDNKNFRHLN